MEFVLDYVVGKIDNNQRNEYIDNYGIIKCVY